LTRLVQTSNTSVQTLARRLYLRMFQLPGYLITIRGLSVYLSSREYETSRQTATSENSRIKKITKGWIRFSIYGGGGARLYPTRSFRYIVSKFRGRLCDEYRPPISRLSHQTFSRVVS